jgi:hypothetical protein
VGRVAPRYATEATERAEPAIARAACNRRPGTPSSGHRVLPTLERPRLRDIARSRLHQETAVDLNQLYFDHQIQLIRADGARTADVRRGHQFAASQIADRIGRRQAWLGAAAAGAWMTSARAVAA